jgi:transposase
MVWRPTTRTRQQREERRLEAARHLASGEVSQAEIARQLGVSRAAVTQWKQRLAQERSDSEALRNRAGVGRPAYLLLEQWRNVLRALGRGAEAEGFDTDRWTLVRIRDLIKRMYGVEYNANYLSVKLRSLGWTPQVPTPRPREREDELVEAWLKRDWPRIKKRLAESGPKSSSLTKRASGS